MEYPQLKSPRFRLDGASTRCPAGGISRGESKSEQSECNRPSVVRGLAKSPHATTRRTRRWVDSSGHLYGPTSYPPVSTSSDDVLSFRWFALLLQNEGTVANARWPLPPFLSP
ncbi:hypothetical protein M407DRAFT_246498 [Tulasnella calospora MUT 4182]|uniref:Uncharacterized protein n=1 Tax=Tulasnella calospora MUT 4182 TaxID=1051891 RepID=A0A0C3PU82_9AGAM|nr:hypothetical protein M407DRAFT_246498 [Tulasnella calospora MUT 4182]